MPSPWMNLKQSGAHCARKNTALPCQNYNARIVTRLVMRISVFNETPAFLSATLMRRAWVEHLHWQLMSSSNVGTSQLYCKAWIYWSNEWRPSRSK